MSAHSQAPRWHIDHLEEPERDQNTDGRLQHEIAANGRLRFAILKNNDISHFSDDNTQVVFAHQLMTFAAKVPRQKFATKVPSPIVTNRLIQ